jgi:hypothetical protein
MIDTLGTAETQHRLIRRKEKDKAMWLTLPAFIVIVLPMFCVVVAALMGRFDLVTAASNAIRQYEVFALVVALMTMPSLCYALYLVIWKDLVELLGVSRQRVLVKKFTPDYYVPLPRWLVISIWSWAITAVGLFALFVYLMFMR